jgi:hypothetical protein
MHLLVSGSFRLLLILQSVLHLKTKEYAFVTSRLCNQCRWEKSKHTSVIFRVLHHCLRITGTEIFGGYVLFCKQILCLRKNRTRNHTCASTGSLNAVPFHHQQRNFIRCKQVHEGPTHRVPPHWGQVNRICPKLSHSCGWAHVDRGWLHHITSTLRCGKGPT